MNVVLVNLETKRKHCRQIIIWNYFLNLFKRNFWRNLSKEWDDSTDSNQILFNVCIILLNYWILFGYLTSELNHLLYSPYLIFSKMFLVTPFISYHEAILASCDRKSAGGGHREGYRGRALEEEETRREAERAGRKRGETLEREWACQKIQTGGGEREPTVWKVLLLMATRGRSRAEWFRKDRKTSRWDSW